MAQKEAGIANQRNGQQQTATALREALKRAEKAEAKLAELQHPDSEPGAESPASKARPAETKRGAGSGELTYDSALPDTGGIEEIRKDSMMSHLFDSLEAGKDIGHYGRLVFAMIARHFLTGEAVLSLLTKDPDFSAEQARLMLRQVEGRDYNPPKRERILEWQAEQQFPILPDPEDPNCGNVYRTLTFPDSVYEHIGQYQERKMESVE